VHVPSSGIGRAQTVLPRLLDRRDRDGLEGGTGDDFDWGRDETPRRSARRSSDFYGDDRGQNEVPRAPRVARAPRVDDEGGAAKASSILYRVGENESVGSIARAFGTTPTQIIEDNYLDPDGKLQKGMLLVVEVSPRSMNRIMKKRAQTRIDDAAGAPSAPESGAGGDAPPSPRKIPGFYPDADGRSIGSRG
jgi:hypothetical protein